MFGRRWLPWGLGLAVAGVIVAGVLRDADGPLLVVATFAGLVAGGGVVLLAVAGAAWTAGRVATRRRR